MRISFRFPASVASERTRAIRSRSLLLCVILIVVLPLAWRGPSCGQDLDFHFQNWLEAARSWHEGVIYPRWAESPNFQAGEPRLVFYPPLSWMTGGALGSVLPWTWTPLGFTLLALLAAGWSMRAMVREWAADDNGALAACLYVANPYMLFVIYERAAFAELMSAVWIPLLVLYALRQRPSFLPLSLSVAALWLTDAPAAVMGSYMLAVLVAVAAAQERSWNRVGRAAAAVSVGLGLSGVWLVPAYYEERWVQIQRAIGPLMRVEDSFFFGHGSLGNLPRTPDELIDLQYHNHVLRMASWVELPLLVGTLVAAWYGRRSRSLLWLPLVLVGAAVAMLQFPFSELVWRHLPDLAYLQFPWRWMLVLGMIFAALAGLALRREAPTRRALARRAGLVLLMAAGMAALAAAVFWQACDEDDNLPAQMQTFQTSGFSGTDEYTLQGVDLSEEGTEAEGSGGGRTVTVVNAAGLDEAGWPPPDENAEVIPSHVRIEKWQSEHRTADVNSARPGYAVFDLTDYPAWRVTVNGRTAVGIRHRNDGLIAIPVSAGNNRIDIRWQATADQRAGLWLSIVAAVILAACGFWQWRTKQPSAIGVGDG